MIRRTSIPLWATLLLLAPVHATHAHGIPPELAFWGGFDAPSAQCQRAIAQAATRCFKQLLPLELQCRRAAFSRVACDGAATAAHIAAIRRTAQDHIEAMCPDPAPLQNLLFIDAAEAVAAADSGCSELTAAALSAVFDPLARTPPTAVGEKTPLVCAEAASAAAHDVTMYVVRARQRAFQYIAAVTLHPARKRALVAHSAARIGRYRNLVEERLTRACPADDFRALYGRAPSAFLDELSAQADCLPWFVYIQTALECPPGTCGNGRREVGEQCDDGNRVPTDGCTNACRLP